MAVVGRLGPSFDTSYSLQTTGYTFEDHTTRFSLESMHDGSRRLIDRLIDRSIETYSIIIDTIESVSSSRMDDGRA